MIWHSVVPVRVSEAERHVPSAEQMILLTLAYICQQKWLYGLQFRRAMERSSSDVRARQDTALQRASCGLPGTRSNNAAGHVGNEREAHCYCGARRAQECTQEDLFAFQRKSPRCDVP